MKRAISSVFSALFALLFSCDEKRSGQYEVLVSETRPLTSLDTDQKRFASAGERFYDQKPSPYLGDTPSYWVAVQPRQFEEAAYRVNGARLTVSRVGGDILRNANRWFGQFGQENIGVKELKEMPRITIAGREAVLIKMAGTFTGRAGPPRPGQVLIGAIAQLEDQLLVLKFVGAEETVNSEEDNFKRFAATLRSRPGGTTETDNDDPEKSKK